MGKLDNYEEVKDRLPRFWGCVKNGRITTEVVDHSENWDRVVIKASLYDGETLIATGIAMDWKDKDRNANRTNWVEVAETSAIGRAIANSRYQDPKAARPSREEMEVCLERQEPVASTPVVYGGAVTASSAGIAKIIFQHGLSEAAVNVFFSKRNWIKPGESWAKASAAQLDIVYGRAKENKEGFAAAISA